MDVELEAGSGTAAQPDAVIHVESEWQRAWNVFYDLLGRVETLLTPTVVCLVILPMIMMVLIYLSAMTVYLHQNWGRLTRRLQAADDLHEAGRTLITYMWDAFGWFYFGYEVRGLENVPDSGSCLILYYHGALPVDYYFFVAKGKK